MDQEIRPIVMKPKIRLVQAPDVGCRGCDIFGKGVIACHEKFACVPRNGPLMHVRIVGEHPSTR